MCYVTQLTIIDPKTACMLNKLESVCVWLFILCMLCNKTNN